VTDAGCHHQPLIVGGRKPKDVPEFIWINTRDVPAVLE